LYQAQARADSRVRASIFAIASGGSGWKARAKPTFSSSWATLSQPMITVETGSD
jgi:hypothetical protein